MDCPADEISAITAEVARGLTVPWYSHGGEGWSGCANGARSIEHGTLLDEQKRVGMTLHGVAGEDTVIEIGDTAVACTPLWIAVGTDSIHAFFWRGAVAG